MIVIAVTLWHFEEKRGGCHSTLYLHNCCNSAGGDVCVAWGYGVKIVGKEALEAERPRALAGENFSKTPPSLALLDDPRAI